MAAQLMLAEPVDYGAVPLVDANANEIARAHE